MSEAPLISLVTGTRNRGESIERFLDTALRYTEGPFEILIADASDVTGTLQSLDPRVQILRESPRLGYARGFNRLFAASRGEIVVYLNDDLELLPGWARPLRRAFRDPRLGLLCLPNVEPTFPGAFFLRYDDVPIANFGAVRREAGESVGWFSECFDHYGTDTDFSLKIYATGRWKVHPCMRRVLIHHVPDDEERRTNHPGHAQSNRLLAERWGEHLPFLRRRFYVGLATAWERLIRDWSPTYDTSRMVLPEVLAPKAPGGGARRP